MTSLTLAVGEIERLKAKIEKEECMLQMLEADYEVLKKDRDDPNFADVLVHRSPGQSKGLQRTKIREYQVEEYRIQGRIMEYTGYAMLVKYLESTNSLLHLATLKEYERVGLVQTVPIKEQRDWPVYVAGLANGAVESVAIATSTI